MYMHMKYEVTHYFYLTDRKNSSENGTLECFSPAIRACINVYNFEPCIVQE